MPRKLGNWISSWIVGSSLNLFKIYPRVYLLLTYTQFHAYPSIGSAVILLTVYGRIDIRRDRRTDGATDPLIESLQATRN